MKWGFFRKDKKDKLFLCLDIGTEAVKALIFSSSEQEKNKKPITVLAAGSSYFIRDNIWNSGSFGKEVMKNSISEAVKQAKQNLSFASVDKKIKEKALSQKKWQVLLGLPPNILKARITEQNYLRKKPKEKISEEEEKNICFNVFEAAKKRIADIFAKEFGILTADIEWVNLKILELKIDGYLVENIKNYQGKVLEFKLLAVFSPKQYLKNAKEVAESLGFEIIKISHLAEGLSLVYEKKTHPDFYLGNLSKQENSIFFDIGGEITQIFLVKNGQLSQINEFKGGGGMFSQRLSEDLGVDLDTARMMKNNYSKKELSPDVLKKIEGIFFWERKIWYDSLKRRLAILNPKSLYQIFLFGGGSFLPDIARVLEEKTVLNWKDSANTVRSKIKLLCLSDFKDIRVANQNPDNFQYIPCLFLIYNYNG